MLKYTHLCMCAHYSEPVPSATQTKELQDAGSGYGRTLSKARPAKAVQVTYGRASSCRHRGPLAPASDQPHCLIWRPRPVQPSAFSFRCHRFTEPVTISFRDSVKCVWGMVLGVAVRSGQVGASGQRQKEAQQKTKSSPAVNPATEPTGRLRSPHPGECPMLSVLKVLAAKFPSPLPPPCSLPGLPARMFTPIFPLWTLLPDTLTPNSQIHHSPRAGSKHAAAFQGPQTVLCHPLPCVHPLSDAALPKWQIHTGFLSPA